MSAAHLLAIDAGTGSCRAVLFDLDGAQVGVAQREWTHLPVPGVPGSQDFDTRTGWRLICEAVRACLADARVEPGAVAAVSATSMREGMVLFDAAGEELWACPNVDSRAREEAAELVGSGDAEHIYRVAGDWVAITSPARFLWLARHEPALLERAAAMGMLSDWILFRLCGEHVTEPTVGSSSGMFDLAARGWSDEVIARCEAPPEIFPRVVEPGTQVGVVTARAAQETGLPAGTPVVAGGGDTQLGLVGIGVTQPGRMTVVGGSFWQHTVVLDEPLVDPQARLRTLCHATPERWMIEGIGFYSGLTMRWFRDAFCDLERERGRRDGVDPYVLMEQGARDVPPGANGVLGVFSNVMNARRWVHAAPAFIQFDLANPASSGKKECVRAIQEAAAYVAEAHRRIVEELTGQRFEEVVFTGGSAQGELWPQVLADVLGAAVHVPVVKESTALGAAVFAGLGVGLFDGLDDVLPRVVRFERTVEPDAEAHAVYAELYERWAGVYESELRLSESGLTTPLWRAAGT